MTQRDLKATTPRLRRTPPVEGNEAAFQRAMESCEAAGHGASDHFRGVTKMVAKLILYTLVRELILNMRVDSSQPVIHIVRT